MLVCVLHGNSRETLKISADISLRGIYTDREAAAAGEPTVVLYWYRVLRDQGK
jgi:hypothetical protein